MLIPVKIMPGAKRERVGYQRNLKVGHRTQKTRYSVLGYIRVLLHRLYIKPNFGRRDHPLAYLTSMFIAIIGTRLSGKSTVETYLTEKGFLPVRIIPQHSGYRERPPAQTRNLVGGPIRARSSFHFRQSFSLSCRQFQGMVTVSFRS